MESETMVFVVPIYEYNNDFECTFRSILAQDTLQKYKIVSFLGESIAKDVQIQIEEVLFEVKDKILFKHGLHKEEFAKDLFFTLSEMGAEYFYICQAGHEWRNDTFISEAVEFLDSNKDFVGYSTNTYFVEKGCDLIDVSKTSAWEPGVTEHNTYGIDEFIFLRAIIPSNIVYRYNAEMAESAVNVIYEEDGIYEALYLIGLKFGKLHFVNEIADICKRSTKNEVELIRIKNTIAVAKTYSCWERDRIFKKLYGELLAYYSNRKLTLSIEPLSAYESMLLPALLQELQVIDLNNNFQCYSLGKLYPDKVFFVIYASDTNWGLYTTFFSILSALEFAKKNGCIPIIDLKNHYLKSYQDIEKAGNENGWEYYYNQPDGNYSLEAVYQSCNVILCDLNKEGGDIIHRWNDLFVLDTEICLYWNAQIRKIELNSSVYERLLDFLQQHEFGRKRILGVSVRAGYVANSIQGVSIISNHPKQPQLQESVEKIRRYMKEWNCEKVFIAIDDREWHDILAETLGDTCIFIERARTHFFENGLVVNDVKDKTIEFTGTSIVEQNIGYILETYVLSQCTALYCGKSSASQIAYYLNGNQYEHIDIYDGGMY